MRLFKGSECPLAPEYGYKNVCSIEILRTALDSFDKKQDALEEKWISAVEGLWNLWKNLTYRDGQKGTQSN